MISKVYYGVSHAGKNGLIADRVEAACSFLTRLRGLLGRKNLDEGEGLLLWPCSSIHCFGMHFSIDVIFLDKKYRVVDIRENMMPGSHASNRNAYYVLELKSGEVNRNQIENGEQLVISFNSPLNK